jgi:hypothetical protein
MTTSIKIRRAGQLLKAYSGCRLHGTGTVSGVVGSCVCFREIMVGDAADYRRGVRLTSDAFGGPVTVEVFDASGRHVATFGLATTAEVKNHPKCTAIA